MKPHRIILVRHGECHANTDESKFATEPDYIIELTENGIRQAYEAGLKLKELVENETLYSILADAFHIVRSFPFCYLIRLFKRVFKDGKKWLSSL